MSCAFFFFFNDTATTEIYTLSLHDALPISKERLALLLTTYSDETASLTGQDWEDVAQRRAFEETLIDELKRSEEHTSELQSQSNLVCRLLLEKKKERSYNGIHNVHHTPELI